MRIRMSLLGQMKERRAETPRSDLPDLNARERLHQRSKYVLMVTTDKTLGQSTAMSLGSVQ
jgi:hypothetical protein